MKSVFPQSLISLAPPIEKGFRTSENISLKTVQSKKGKRKISLAEILPRKRKRNQFTPISAKKNPTPKLKIKLSFNKATTTTEFLPVFFFLPRSSSSKVGQISNFFLSQLASSQSKIWFRNCQEKETNGLLWPYPITGCKLPISFSCSLILFPLNLSSFFVLWVW